MRSKNRENTEKGVVQIKSSTTAAATTTTTNELIRIKL